MFSNKLPSVLTAKNPNDSLSMERSLRQIQCLLAQIEVDGTDENLQDMVNASLDDIHTMLAAIDRG